MNLAEHPQAIRISKAIRASPEKFIPLQVFIPGLRLSGVVTMDDETPGLFMIAAPVQPAPNTEPVITKFTFTCDQLLAAAWPDLDDLGPESPRIIS